jgi:hypothetical protein
MPVRRAATRWTFAAMRSPPPSALYKTLSFTALADDTKAEKGDTHDGTVVSVTADKLVMKSKAKDGEDAKEFTHRLAAAMAT